MNQCIYCQREFTNPGGLGSHILYCQSNPNRVNRTRSPDAGRKKGKEYFVWNRGKTGLQVAWNKGITGSTTGRASTEEKELARRSKISEKAKLNNGGYRQGSGRGKKGWYKGFFCDSSWELAYVVYCLEHDIDIKRNTQKRQYVWEGVVKNYIPDFIVQGILTEVKGYKTEQWLAKLNANPDIRVLYETDLIPILEYVKDKYGKDFINLYE
jgi:hypothetical protein